MNSTVKHYKVNPNGSLRFVGTENIRIPAEGPARPVEIGRRRENGRLTVTFAAPKAERGRPVDPAKVNYLGRFIDPNTARRIGEIAYDGRVNPDDGGER